MLRVFYSYKGPGARHEARVLLQASLFGLWVSVRMSPRGSSAGVRCCVLSVFVDPACV